MSLREQLLKAGLVNEQQAREAERQLQRQQQDRQQQPKRQRDQPTERDRAAQQRVAAKAARDQELNRLQRDQAERKERQAQARQLIEQNCLPKIDSEDYFNFVDGRRVRRIAVDAVRRERLNSGELVIVRCGARCELVTAEVAERVGERDARAVIAHAAPAAAAEPSDDAYRDFAVPDDLMW